MNKKNMLSVTNIATKLLRRKIYLGVVDSQQVQATSTANNIHMQAEWIDPSLDLLTRPLS